MSDTDITDAIEDGPTTTFVRDRLTLLVYGMTMAFGFAVASLGPAMPSLRDDLGISRTVGGLHFTALAAGAVLAGFGVERIVRSWGRRRVFWCGGAGIAAGSLVIGAGWHPVVTVAGALLVGGFGAAMLTVNSATVSDVHPGHHEVALTELNTASSAGSVVPAVLIGALVAAGAGWRPAFAVPTAVLVVFAMRRHAVPFPPASSRSSDPHRPLPLPYWFFWAAFAPAVGAEWALGAWGAGYLVDVAGTADESASFLMTAFFAAMLVGRVLGGFVARTVSAFRLLVGTAAIGLGGSLLFWASSDAPMIVAGLVVAGLGISMLFPMLLALAIDSAAGRSDSASARVFVASGGAVLVAPLTLGAVADQTTIRAAFAIVPGLFVVLVILAALGRRAATSRVGGAPD